MNASQGRVLSQRTAAKSWQFILERDPSGRKATIGHLSLNGREMCDTLEDVVREVPGKPVADWKVPGKTAIPAGTYSMILTPSERARRGALWTPDEVQCRLPLLLAVPGFDGIRIHAGNTSEDVEGCIAVGQAVGDEELRRSRSALECLMEMLEIAEISHSAVTIEIRTAPEEMRG